MTPYKVQGSEFERMIVDDYDFVHIPGIWLVDNTRILDAKHVFRVKYPIAADIQVQRLQNPFVIEAEIYERRVKIKSAQTLRRNTKEGRVYGEQWTTEENRVADLVAKAWQQKIIIPQNIHQFIQREHAHDISDSMLKNVITKMEKTHEILLQQDPPYLSGTEYKTLLEHGKRTKRM